MKARIVETGEKITIIGISSEYGTAQFYGSDGVLHIRNFSDGDIQLLSDKTIDWEQRRYEIAKEALSGILVDEDQVTYACAHAVYAPREKHTVPKAVSQMAVACADALIEELKRTEK